MTDNLFGRFFRRLRESKGLGTNQLAAKSGVSNAEISRIESGERKRPHPDTLMKLARALGHPVEDFYARLGYLAVDSVNGPPLVTRVRKLAESAGLAYGDVLQKADVEPKALVYVDPDDPDPYILWPVARVLRTSIAYLAGETDDPRPIMQPGQAAHNAINPFGGADLTPKDIQDMERTYLRIEKRRAERGRLKGDSDNKSN